MSEHLEDFDVRSHLGGEGMSDVLLETVKHAGDLGHYMPFPVPTQADERVRLEVFEVSALVRREQDFQWEGVSFDDGSSYVSGAHERMLAYKLGKKEEVARRISDEKRRERVVTAQSLAYRRVAPQLGASPVALLAYRSNPGAKASSRIVPLVHRLLVDENMEAVLEGNEGIGQRILRRGVGWYTGATADRQRQLELIKGQSRLVLGLALPAFALAQQDTTHTIRVEKLPSVSMPPIPVLD